MTGSLWRSSNRSYWATAGPRHAETLKALVEARANVNLPDRNGDKPLALARSRRYGAIVKLLEQAGAR